MSDRSVKAEELTFEWVKDAELFRSYHFDEGLHAFRPAARQYAAVLELLVDGQTLLSVARKADLVVGYVIATPADPRERWGNTPIAPLLRDTSVEVSKSYRHGGTARRTLGAMVEAGALEPYIAFATCFSWHWDLSETNGDPWRYREMLYNVFAPYDFVLTPTNEPNLTESPVNMLLVRYGSGIDSQVRETFQALCRDSSRDPY